MRLAIITHADHVYFESAWYAYGPYVREMNLWIQHAKEIRIVAPVRIGNPMNIDMVYEHQTIAFSQIPSVSLTSVSNFLAAVWHAPSICYKIWKAMRKADHIHLRCPGNMGLLGCILQVCFPGKKKTAKYAGNWDPNAKQPWSYRFQKWLLSNTFLTRNMQVLVYGEWKGQTRNIKPFFTATYMESKTEIPVHKVFRAPLKFVFAGNLVPGKRPLYAVKLIKELRSSGFDCRLDLYGEGPERAPLNNYIEKHGLIDFISLHGNRPAEDMEQAYRTAHFLLLPSKSEGWPKVVAEAMFWGAVAIVTSISCVPWMLDQGNRGILISAKLKEDAEKLTEVLSNESLLQSMSEKGRTWSRKYTLESFASEIKKLL